MVITRSRGGFGYLVLLGYELDTTSKIFKKERAFG